MEKWKVDAQGIKTDSSKMKLYFLKTKLDKAIANVKQILF